MQDHLMTAAVVFLVLFVFVAAIDGFYFHLWKYRLYARPESRYEHKLHTLRAFLFVPILYFLFYRNFGGLALWFGVFFIWLDTIVELIDVFSEKDARAELGGLSSIEYAAHVAATTLRAAFISLALAAKPLSAWSLSAPIVLEQEYSTAAFVALNLMPGNVLAGVLHLWLMRDKYMTKIKFLPIRNCCGSL